MMISIASCATISPDKQADPIVNAKAACPVPLFPSDEAWQYRDSLPAATPAQLAFREWTGRIIVQQTLLK